MIDIKIEKITEELIGELTPILEAHRVELSSHQDMRLNPDWDTYKVMEEMGGFITMIARDKGEIVGYTAFFIANNMHYMDFKYAMQDVFYVTQDRRGSVVAKKLLVFSEEVLADIKVSTIVHHVKMTNRFGEFLEKFGYKHTEKMYAKRID